MTEKRYRVTMPAHHEGGDDAGWEYSTPVCYERPETFIVDATQIFPHPLDNPQLNFACICGYIAIAEPITDDNLTTPRA